MKAIQLKSPAKLNLYLECLYKRSDNFHQIQTIFERINLFDDLVLERTSQKRIRIFCGSPDVPCDETNLCYKAARILQREYRSPYGADIHIQKNIPVASGLAGGSGNAAAVLLGLNKLWGLDLGKYALIDHGRRIGSDVSFFLYDVSFAFATGRGDEIQPLAINHHFWHILAVPQTKIYTKDAYRNLRLTRSTGSGSILSVPNRRKNPGRTNVLTNPQTDVNILIYALRNNEPKGVAANFYNCLEAPALALDKTGLILKLKKDFQKANLRPLMTGSGPAIFAILRTRKEAEQLAKRFRHQRVFVVETF